MASGAYTHTHTHTHTHFGGMKVIIRNQARAGLRPVCAWFKNDNSISSYSPNVHDNNEATKDRELTCMMVEIYLNWKPNT